MDDANLSGFPHKKVKVSFQTSSFSPVSMSARAWLLFDVLELPFMGRREGPMTDLFKLKDSVGLRPGFRARQKETTLRYLTGFNSFRPIFKPGVECVEVGSSCFKFLFR